MTEATSQRCERRVISYAGQRLVGENGVYRIIGSGVRPHDFLVGHASVADAARAKTGEAVRAARSLLASYAKVNRNRPQP